MTKTQLAIIEKALESGEPELLSQALILLREWRVRPQAPSSIMDSAHPLVRHFPRGLGPYGYLAHCLSCALIWSELPVNQMLEGAFPACAKCGSRDVQRRALTESQLFVGLLADDNQTPVVEEDRARPSHG